MTVSVFNMYKVKSEVSSSLYMKYLTLFLNYPQ